LVLVHIISKFHVNISYKTKWREGSNSMPLVQITQEEEEEEEEEKRD